MMIYLYVAVIVLIFSVLEVFSPEFQKKYGKKIYYLLLTFLALGFMTRWFVGWDWYNYYPDYYNSGSKFEIGYRIFALITRKISENYQLFVAINSLIDFLILGWIIPKYSKYPITTLSLYLGINGLALETDIMRNVKSILLFLISIQFIERKKFLPYLLINLLGMGFHITSIVYLPLYFILGERYSRKVVVTLFILGNIFYLSNSRVMVELLKYINFGRVQGYVGLIPENLERGIDIFYIERLIFFAVVYFGERLVKKESVERYRIFENSAYIGIFIFLFLGQLSVVALRLSLLFSFAYWFIFTIILENIEMKREIRAAIYILAVTIGIFRGLNFLTFEGNRATYRYENYFMKKRDIEEKKKEVKAAFKYREAGIKRELLILY